MYLWVNLTYLKRPEFYILDLFLSNTPVSHQKIQIIIAKRQNKNLIYRADKNQANFQKQIKYRKTNKKNWCHKHFKRLIFKNKSNTEKLIKKLVS
jgi:hypothetical protein